MEVLLIGAVACIAALLISAWLMTFARWFVIKGVDGKIIVDYATMIRAHVDYALMALFGLSFYAAGVAANIEYCIWPCLALAIGGFTNPTIFVIASFDPKFWEKVWVKIYTMISFLLTTIGFTWLCCYLVCFAWDKLS